MPISYHIRPDLRLTISTHVGVVPDHEFLQSYEALYADDAFDLSFDRLVDLRQADSRARSADALRRIAAIVVDQYRDTQLRPKTAVLAPSSLSFGLSRMYEAFASAVPGEFVVFRATDAALAWLGVEPDVLPECAMGDERPTG